MGFFGFGKSESKVEKLKKKATNPYGQAIERQMALKALNNMGTPDAISALLARYTVNLESSITDQDEKRDVYEWLVEAGEKAIAPIEEFVSKHDGVYWPLKALKEIAGLERAVDSLIAALDRAETISIRINEQRAQLVSNLRDFPHPKVLARLKQLASDPNPDVRLMALDGLLTYGEEEALEIVAERLIHPEETASVRAVLFEQLVDLGWSLTQWRDQLVTSEILPGHYTLDSASRIVRAR